MTMTAHLHIEVTREHFKKLDLGLLQYSEIDEDSFADVRIYFDNLENMGDLIAIGEQLEGQK